MSGYDPFSGIHERNLLQHVFAPKIVGPTGGQYQVALDIVNIDTIYANNVVIGGTGGGTGGGSIGATGPTGATGYTGATGTFIFSGPTGAVLFYDGATVRGETGFTYANGVAKPFEVIMENKTSTSGFEQTLRLTAQPNNGRSYIQPGITNTAGVGGYLDIGKMYTAPNPTVSIDTHTNRVGINKDTPVYTLDVGGQTQITYNGTTAAIQTYVGASGNSGTFTVPGTTGTYKLYAWGQGGFAAGGIGGGGGYVETSITLSGATGSFTWGATGGGLDWDGQPSGGDALYVIYNNGAGATGYVLWAPGGGGGGPSGAVGAPYGSPAGLPSIEGGLSATPTSGGTGGTATYIDSTDGRYAVPGFTVAGITAGTSSQLYGATSGFLSANISGGQGLVAVFSGIATETPGGAYTDIFLASGMIGMTGMNLTFPSTQFTSYTVPTSFPVTNYSVLNSAFSAVGYTGATSVATFTPPGVTGTIASGTIYGTTGTLPVGTVTTTNVGMNLIGTTTLRVYPQGAYSKVGSTYTINSTTGATKVDFTSTSAYTITTGIASTNSTFAYTDAFIPVTERQYIYRGNNGSAKQGAVGPIGVPSGNGGGGGGGGWYGGGAAAFGPSGIQSPFNQYSGGGAGSAYIASSLPGIASITGITGAANGYQAYINQYNPLGEYGRGSHPFTYPNGNTGYFNRGPGWLVIEYTDTSGTTVSPALIVNGNIQVNSNINVSRYGGTGTNQVVVSGGTGMHADMRASGLPGFQVAGMCLMNELGNTAGIYFAGATHQTIPPNSLTIRMNNAGNTVNALNIGITGTVNLGGGSLVVKGSGSTGPQLAEVLTNQNVSGLRLTAPSGNQFVLGQGAQTADVWVQDELALWSFPSTGPQPKIMGVGATGLTSFYQPVGVGLPNAQAPLHVYTGTTGNTNSTLRLESAVSTYGGSNEGSSLDFYTRRNLTGVSYFQSAIRGIDDNANGGGSGDGGMSFVVNKNTVQTEAMRLNSNLNATFAGAVNILGSLTIASLLGNLVQSETWTWLGNGTTRTGYYCKLGNLIVRWCEGTNVTNGAEWGWSGPAFTNNDYMVLFTAESGFMSNFCVISTLGTYMTVGNNGTSDQTLRMMCIGIA